MPSDSEITVIVLAAQRDGRIDPLAAEAQVSHKCLVPIAGKPLLAHVLKALGEARGIGLVRIAVEAGAKQKLEPIISIVGNIGCGLEFVPSADTITDSVYAAAEGVRGNIVVTTADNVLLSPAAVEKVIAMLRDGDDAVVALARKEAVLFAHPEGQRHFYKFADASIANCNLYGLSRQGLGAAEVFRTGGQFASNPARIAQAFGFLNLLMFSSGLITVDGVMRRLSKRFGVRMKAVILDDGAHAIDVDNDRTYRIAAQILERRLAQHTN